LYSILLIAFFFRQCFKDTGNFATARLKARDNILSRRLQQADDLADHFRLVLQRQKRIEAFVADKESGINGSAFENRFFAVLVADSLVYSVALIE